LCDNTHAYEAALVLSGVGDALGYRGSRWEYCTSGPQIHAELAQLGGLGAIALEPPEWPVSDDPVLHLATAEGSAQTLVISPVLVGCTWVRNDDFEGSCPQNMSWRSVEWGGGGRKIFIVFCPIPVGKKKLVEIVVFLFCFVLFFSWKCLFFFPPLWYLGALAVALFGALGARGEPPEKWGAELLRVLPQAWDYVESTGVAVGDNAAAWPFFRDAWRRYLESRGLLEGSGPPRLPALPSPAERDAEYLGWALGGWPGRSGHDAPMVALEALLAAGGCWATLCHRGVLHGGDNDSTGTIAAGCWGLLGGLAAVPPGLHRGLEYRGRLSAAARRLHELAWGGATVAMA
uniref:ADP-ribosylarginine hydrolase n=1 Tax=Anas zonorhyncha TaxID=75864 RepID=A0A8B9VQU8_9AVES